MADVDALQLPAGVDRVFVVSTASDTEVPWLLIAVSVGLAILGVGLLAAVRRRGRRGMASAAGGS